MKFFVTGHRGYIGVHLVELLKEAGHSITGCDLGLYADCGWEPHALPDYEIQKDIRSLHPKDMEGHDVICHLAAISNDPMGELSPEITYSINCNASVELAKAAKFAGVQRFLLAGSCSVYGKGEKPDLEETDPLSPLSAYAESKIEAEKGISGLADAEFSPVFLRNATAYGHSPMLRIDLVVNNLLGSAHAYNEIRIHSDGSPWRPLIHCRDIARAFIALAEAPLHAVHNKAINIGDNNQNYQIRDIGNMVKQLIPGASIEYTGRTGADPRNYRVKFDLLKNILPDFNMAYPLEKGMKELHQKMIEHGFSKTDFEGDRFVRLRILKKRMQMITEPC